jgi:uncharacterized protein YndB with AHSA1/START domain
MPDKFINKKITIQAPTPKVWKVLVRKQYIEQWIYEFSEGNVITEDWQLNSKIAMADNEGAVLSEGKITEFEPNRRLKIEFENNNYTEELTLTAKGNLTHLSAYAGPVARTEHKEHAEVWGKGLSKIKKLSEAL